MNQFSEVSTILCEISYLLIAEVMKFLEVDNSGENSARHFFRLLLHHFKILSNLDY